MKQSMRIAVVDDDRTVVQEIAAGIAELCKRRGIVIDIAAFFDGKELMEGYCCQYDAVFLDIEMKELGGMEAARSIRRTDMDTPIIFVTQLAQYALEGYRVDALDFLVKPLSQFDLEMVFVKLLRHLKRQPEKQVALQVRGETMMVSVSEIYCAEVLDHYVTYRTKRGEFRVRQTLAEAQKALGGVFFLRCSRYGLVNVRHITAVHKDRIQAGEIWIDLSLSRRKEILQAVARYMGGE